MSSKLRILVADPGAPFRPIIEVDDPTPGSDIRVDADMPASMQRTAIDLLKRLLDDIRLAGHKDDPTETKLALWFNQDHPDLEP